MEDNTTRIMVADLVATRQYRGTDQEHIEFTNPNLTKREENLAMKFQVRNTVHFRSTQHVPNSKRKPSSTHN